MNINYFYL